MQEINKRTINTFSRLGQRGSIFGMALPEIAAEKENIRVITADLGLLSGLDRFRKAYPERYINVGIAEQNMVAISAGLAKEGNCVFATTYATFCSLRCTEQIRHNLGYMKFNVKIVGSSAGFAMGMSGNTHYANEDIAVMRAIPNMTVISPADASEAYLTAFVAANSEKPAYIRLTGVLNCPPIYKENYTFEIGKGIVIKQGSDIAIISNGTILHEAINAAEILEQKGISCTVINMHTVKPLDTDLLYKVFKEHKTIVTIEEHSTIGGLGSAVAEYKAGIKNTPRQIIFGTPDNFGKAAEYRYLLEQYGLTAEQLAKKIEQELK